jgi:hypothetical protein
MSNANQKTGGAMGGFVKQSPLDYQAVPASQTDLVLGTTGAIGDLLQRLVISVATAASGTVSIQDGADTATLIMPNSPGGGIGVYVVELGIASRTGAWSVTTGAGSTVLAIGLFT